MKKMGIEAISVFVKNKTPSFAKSSRLLAKPEIKLKISYPTPVLNTNNAMMNCMSIPTRTVCHLTCARCLLVTHSAPININNPKSDTARLSRVLFSDSSDANEPMRIIVITEMAAIGVRNFSGIAKTMRPAVACQTVCMGLMKMPIGTHRNTMRRDMESQTRKGTIQFLSFRWRMRDAIHHLHGAVGSLGSNLSRPYPSTYNMPIDGRMPIARNEKGME